MKYDGNKVCLKERGRHSVRKQSLSGGQGIKNNFLIFGIKSTAYIYFLSLYSQDASVLKEQEEMLQAQQSVSAVMMFRLWD